MKKSNLIIVSAALAAAVISLPVAAQSKAAAQPSWYIGGGLGQSHSTDSTFSGTTSGVAAPFTVSGFDSNKTSFQIFGGYQFTENWGVELQYTDLGKRNGTVIVGAPINGSATFGDTRAYQWGASVTGTLPFTNEFFGRAKLGVSSNHIDSTSATVSTAAGTAFFNSSGSSNTDVLAGIGLGYKWTEHFLTRLEYEYFGKFDVGNNNSVKGSNIGLRMQYSF
jgi:OOP family OmpA-OmpF porin